MEHYCFFLLLHYIMEHYYSFQSSISQKPVNYVIRTIVSPNRITIVNCVHFRNKQCNLMVVDYRITNVLADCLYNVFSSFIAF